MNGKIYAIGGLANPTAKALSTVEEYDTGFVVTPPPPDYNIGPVADAGLPRYAAQDPVVLDGTSSFDPDNSGTLSYTWRQIDGPSVVIIDSNTATPTIGGSIQPGIGRDKSLKISGFTQTGEIQECEFELVVSDGELTSQPDTVKVVIVPDFGHNFVRHVNPPFDPKIPTLIFFGGGDCVTGKYTWQPDENDIGNRTVNLIPFHDGYMPDKKSGAGWRTYYECGDMIIVYLSSVASDYKMPIHTVGVSTGGQPAVDVGIRLNSTYRDARYAVNRVTLEDASTQCRGWQGYSESIAAFIASSVDGEQCWLDNYVSAEADFYPNVLNVGFDQVLHILAFEWNESSWINAESNKFNNGVVAGNYWSVIGPGKNLQLASTPEMQIYNFKWYGDASSGYMDFYDEPNHPGRLPEPVTLIGPPDEAVVDANGVVLSCEISENAIGYKLLFGSEPYRVMDYMIVSDTPAPPSEVITSFPYEQTWWTIKVYDAFGSTIYADPVCVYPEKVEAPEPGLIANWKLDEIQGDIAYDSVIGSFGNVYGGAIWQPNGGHEGGALEFDGIDDFISIPRVIEAQPESFSVSAWVKGGAPGQVILSQANRSDWLGADTTDGSLMSDMTFYLKTSRPLQSQTVITDDNWHRVGLVWDGSSRILYFDDIEVASDTYVTGFLYGYLQIGAGNKLEADSFWSGLIDEVRIYNRAVTP